MTPTLTRRRVLKILGTTPFAATLGMTACSNGSNSPGGIGLPPEPVAWASGGTDLIAVDFPADDIFAGGNTCQVALTPSLMEGPCYFEDAKGEDISEGQQGLPTQLCLQVIDSECQPLRDYIVEIWHCDTRGIYSADTSASTDSSRFAPGFCAGGDAAARGSSWFRGTLRTDNSGRVNFKTCFPGWYPGRTIHFHFTVSDSAGNNRFISQLCFTDEFAATICTEHERYRDRGEQDTTLASGADMVFPSDDVEPFLLRTRQNSDGSLLAYHRIQVV